MALMKLHARERQSLERIARSSSNAREVRRAQALIWLHRGEPVEQVAQRLSMSRQAIYVLVARYCARKARPVVERVQDQPHTGQPAGKLKKVVKAIQRLLN
jgi:transposase